MDTYIFKAIDLAGAPAGGEGGAGRKQAVTDQLKRPGLLVLDIEGQNKSKELPFEFMQRVKLGDLSVMTRQLSTMIQSGMTILRALNVLENQTQGKLLKATLISVRKDVEAGLPLSDSLERHPKVFGP